jgi:phosphohistidine swiveling domain-containing protein
MSLILVDKNGPEFQKTFERKLPFINLAIQMNGFLKVEKDFFEINNSFAESLIFKKDPEKEYVEGWFILSKYNQVIEEIKSKIKSDPSYVDWVVAKMKQTLGEFKLLSEKSAKIVEDLDKNSQLVKEIANHYYNLSYKSVPAAWSYDILGWSLMEIIEEELRKINMFSEELVVILVSYGLSTIFIEEKKEFLELLSKKEDMNEKIKKHFQKWSFMGMDTPMGKPYDLEFFEKRAEDFLKNKDVEKELLKLTKNRLDELNEFNDKIKLIKDPECLRIIESARKIIKLKNEDRILLHKYIGESIKISDKIREILKIPVDKYSFIGGEEISSYLNDKLTIQEILQKTEDRIKNGFIFRIKNKSLVVENYAKQNDEFIRIVLTGMVASKGKARGAVKIITDPFKQVQKLNAGDILVSVMTTPDFVPLMEKAGAVLTNEGGMLCHAAIISRELGIPAIVGTKKATEILKDGDLVEVDANNGVVKILN